LSSSSLASKFWNANQKIVPAMKARTPMDE
jgi:hypothetical protein